MAIMIVKKIFAHATKDILKWQACYIVEWLLLYITTACISHRSIWMRTEQILEIVKMLLKMVSFSTTNLILPKQRILFKRLEGKPYNMDTCFRGC